MGYIKYERERLSNHLSDVCRQIQDEIHIDRIFQQKKKELEEYFNKLKEGSEYDFNNTNDYTNDN